MGSGARKYMEDFIHVKVSKMADGVHLNYVYLGLFDGHGFSTPQSLQKKIYCVKSQSKEGFGVQVIVMCRRL